jgi:hypothetical protein
MASTYINDLRLNEMATGDGSGTWGTTTNTNLELIAEAFSYGTEVITTNADTHTTTIADGATDPGRALYLKYTGTLDSACTITIGPDTVSKVWIIENGTSGSQNIIISQGSGANITIPAGDTKVVYSDGAGAGAAFVDAFASLNVGALTGTSLDISGDIDVDGTTNLDIVDIDGAVDMASTLAVAGVVTANAGVVVDNITIDGNEIDVGSGDLTLDVAGNTVINSDAGGVYFLDAAVTYATMLSTGAVFNEAAADADFRVESSNNANAFFVDASADQVRTDAIFVHDADGSNQPFYITRTGGLDQALQVTVDDNNVLLTSVQDEVSGANFIFYSTNATTSNLNMLTLDYAAGTVFNEDGVSYQDFRVESDDNTHMLFVDAGNNRVGIGKVAASQPFEVGVSSVFDTAMIVNETGGDHDFRVESDTFTGALTVDGADGHTTIGSGRFSIGAGTARSEFISERSAPSGTNITSIISIGNANDMSSAAAAACTIYGSNNAGSAFMDVVHYTANSGFVVISSSTLEGSPHSRTYVVAGNVLRVTMGAGASGYAINTSAQVLQYPF